MQKQLCADQGCGKGGALKCVVGGLMAGIAVSAVSAVLMSKNKRALQKKAEKVADAMEDLFDSAKDIFK